MRHRHFFLAVCIHNNLTARQTRVAARSANDELAGWIDKVFDGAVEEFLNILGIMSDDTLFGTRISMDILFRYDFCIMHLASSLRNGIRSLTNSSCCVETTMVSILPGFAIIRIL